MSEFYQIAIFLWLWIICSWSALQTFSEAFPQKWAQYNLITKTIAFVVGPILLTIILFLPTKQYGN